MRDTSKNKTVMRPTGKASGAFSHVVGEGSRTTFDFLAFGGFCAFMAALQLYDGYSIMTSVAVFNGALYCAVGRAAVLVVLVVVGFFTSLELPRGITVCSGFVAGACAVLVFVASDPVTCSAVSLLQGASLSVLSVAWGTYLGRNPAGTSCLLVVLSIFFASAICFGVFVVDFAPFGQGVLAAMSVASGLLWVSPRAVLDNSDERDGVGNRFPVFAVSAVALVALALCCVMSSFISGVTLNPYAVQSKVVTAWMHLAATLSFFLMTVDCIVYRGVRLQAFVLGGLGLLLAGLFMITTGVTGSVILPIGLVMATRSLFWGLGWVTVAGLGRARPEQVMGVSAAGMLVVDSAFGRGAGILFGSSGAVSFSELTVFCVVCIMLLAFAYAIMSATSLSRTYVKAGFKLHGRMSQLMVTVEPSEDGGSVDAAEHEVGPEAEAARDEALKSIGLTSKELDVARLLLLNRTYADAAVELGVSASTVKFHAKNIYTKAGVYGKREFLLEFTSVGENEVAEDAEVIQDRPVQ